MSQEGRFFVAVTGAQGVGKSTFCRRLSERLERDGRHKLVLLDGLGDRMKTLGIPLGSASTPQTIAAVFTAHLEREAAAPACLVILDRCVVDGLAYTRALGVSSELELKLYEQVTALAAGRLTLVIHLDLSPFFADKGASHETPELRANMAENITLILDQFRLPSIKLDAATSDAVEQASTAILKRLQ